MDVLVVIRQTIFGAVEIIGVYFSQEGAMNAVLGADWKLDREGRSLVYNSQDMTVTWKIVRLLVRP